jgi:hypothetical protein
MHAKFYFRINFTALKCIVQLQAFFHGKLKIKGNTGLAMKLKDLKMPEGGMKAAPASGNSKPGSEFKVAPVFDLIKAEIEKVILFSRPVFFINISL